MTVGELKKELKKYSDNLEITFTGTIPPDKSNCNCGDYCYCSYQEITFSISQVSDGVTYNGVTKKHEITSVSLVS